MSEGTDRIAVACPACGSDGETVQEVLASGGGLLTVRCPDCSHVHKVDPPGADHVERDVVISQDGESFTASVGGPADETLHAGQEFVVETPEAILAVRITDLEVGPERRTETAAMETVETIWTRAVDNVTVDVTIHPSDGAREETRSVELGLPGDHEFEVGATESWADETFTVEGVVVRGDAVGYPTSKLDRRGDSIPAKDVARVYARDESSDAWSAW